jgi:DNA gyrase subunit A
MVSKEKVVPIDIEDEMKDSYLDYAMSVIVSRALPEARDGLKPVHRRILYTMNELGLFPGKPYRKSAKVVGEVHGSYHPHGDVAIYDTMARMVQDFSLRYPLIDGQGNFGSVDGDFPAAQRYTEVRLTPLAGEILRDLDKGTVDFVPNYDGSLKEPLSLPALLPNLLINGASGIAVGMATHIPPHNLREVVEGTIRLIDNPEVSVEELMKVIPGPDFPTGGRIFGKEGIREAYTKGRGQIILRARFEIEETKGGKEAIIITEIPYQVNKANLIAKIADLVREKKIEGISDLRDESDREGMRILIELKRGEIPEVVLNHLYLHTSLQVTFGAIMLALVRGEPRILNLKEILFHYIEHRKEVITRRTKFELDKAEKRAHILEGLKVALGNLERIIETIKSSPSVDKARDALIKKFALSEEQAQAILVMQLQRLTGLERKKIDEEYLGLIKTIARLKSVLSSEKKILEIIKEGLEEIKEKYGDARRTEILEKEAEFTLEDLIKEEDMAITISHTGYIKRLSLGTYRQQRRGGKGVTGMGTKEEDFVEHLFIASTHDQILFFTNRGRCYWLKVHEVPQAGRLAKGKAIVNLLQVAPGEKIAAFLPIQEFSSEYYLVMATSGGRVKKTALSAYRHPRSRGIIALNLKEGDRLIGVRLTGGKEDIVLSTRQGQAIRFKEEEVRSAGRASQGVIGIRMKKGDEVVGMVVSQRVLPEKQGKEETLLVVTENGYGKRSPLGEYRVIRRGGKGVITIRTSQRNGPVVTIKEVGNEDELMIITSSGMVIRTQVKQISVMRRNTQGVRLIKLNAGDKVVGLAKLAKEEEGDGGKG